MFGKSEYRVFLSQQQNTWRTHNQRKEMKRKRKKKNKIRKTSCVACQSKSLEAASTTNNVKSELMNVCSSSWTVGRIDQLNGFLRFEEFGVKEEDLRVQTGLQVWILQKVRRRRRRRCCCCWWWIGGGACACAFHTWDNLGVVEGRERYTTTGCLVRQILRVSACHIPCHCSSQTRRNTTDGCAISDFLAKKKRKTHPSKTPSPKERRRNWVDKERERKKKFGSQGGRRRTSYALKAWVRRRPSLVKNKLGATLTAGPQVYPGPGVLRAKFLGSLTVVLVLPDLPTVIWKAATALAGSCAKEARTPPRQQLATCWL